jgi:hypothetical protein
MQVRIAIAVERDQRRWIAYGASDTPEREAVATVRDIAGGDALTMWLEVQVPEQPPADAPARFVLQNIVEDGDGTSSTNGTEEMD